MRSSRLALIFALVLVACHAADQASVEWRGVFGARRDPAKKAGDSLVLMRSGFFLAPVVKDFDRLLKELLIEYPDCSVVSVAEAKGWEATHPDSILTYVWLMAKEKNLNLEMIRRGWFSGGTQFTTGNPAGWKRLIPEERDRAFIDQLQAAEEEAQSHHRGIWAEKPE